MNDISVILAFGGGLVSFASPCVLPMAPVYLASLTDSEWLDKNYNSVPVFTVFLHALSFVAGFGIVFTLLGMLAGFTGSTINPASMVVRLMTGGILVLLGIYMLAAIKFPQLNFEKRISFGIIGSRSQSHLRSFITGAVFTIAWTPCVSPILGSVLSLAAQSETVWQGGGLLLVYSFGFGLPFLIIGLAMNTILPLLRKTQLFTKVINITAGILIVFVGLLILLGKLNEVMTWG